ncbi:MAG: DUF1080 domain-containing protein, partial [Sphingomonadales bacterium]
MNKIVLIAFATLICSCQGASLVAQQPNSLSSQERSQGWQLLFDGQTTRGWHKYGGAPIGAAWKVEEGALWLDPSQREGWQIKGGGDIVTDEVFADFHLTLEWKIAQNGNSGIMFYIHEDSTTYQWPWMTAPEMQVLDNEGHPDAKIIKHRAGDLYDLISCSQETVRPFEQWNQVEIICKKGKLDFFLNNVNVVSVQLWGEDWKKRVAASKFSKMPGFGTYQ